MKVLRGFPNRIPSKGGAAVTLGNFDGVHRGHQSLIQRVQHIASERGLSAVAVMFEPQPMEFFRPDDAPPRIYSLSQKLEAMRDAGLDAVCVLPFNQALSVQEPEEFVAQLVENLRMRALLIGDDWRFGRQRRGDFALLTKLRDQWGYTLEQAGTVLDDAERISSTRVREALGNGEVDVAARLLGRHFAVRGRVVYGQQLGRKLNAPTANVALRRVPPLRFGVYTCWLNERPAVANFGIRPTVNTTTPSLEVHVLDSDVDLYNQRVQVRFGAWLRAEQRFDGVDALMAQIHRDFDAARAWHRSNLV